LVDVIEFSKPQITLKKVVSACGAIINPILNVGHRKMFKFQEWALK
jgi:hypothetical protein